MLSNAQAQTVLKEVPGIIGLLENDLDVNEDTLSEVGKAAIEKELGRQRLMIKEAELAIKFIDYQ